MSDLAVTKSASLRKHFSNALFILNYKIRNWMLDGIIQLKKSILTSKWSLRTSLFVCFFSLNSVLERKMKCFATISLTQVNEVNENTCILRILFLKITLTRFSIQSVFRFNNFSRTIVFISLYLQNVFLFNSTYSVCGS